VSVRRFPILDVAPGQRITISMYSPLTALGPRLSTLSGGGVGSGAYPAANAAILVPFVLPRPATVYKAGWRTGGSAPTGNADIGVYNAGGTLLVSSGSTARSGTNTNQIVDLTDTLLPELQLLYMAIAADDQSTWARTAPSNTIIAALGVRSKTASFALPNPISSTVAMAYGFIPEFWLELVVR